MLHDARKVLVIVKNKHEEHMETEERNKQLKAGNQELRERLGELKGMMVERREEKRR